MDRIWSSSRLCARHFRQLPTGSQFAHCIISNYLVVTRKHGVHVLELSQELPTLLAPGCRFEQVASFSAVPEVQKLYRSCQTLHAQLQSAAA